MTTSVHSTLTGADLHESKGVATALSGEVYVADGAGSGAWLPATSIVLNTAFTTGDLKATHKTTADTGWVLWSVGTIGDGSSGGSLRANADTFALFQLYWNNFSNTLCPVTGGRGLTAASDFAAHKVIALPAGPGRAIGVVGSGAGLTARTLGAVVGEETHALIHTEIPTITSSGGALSVSVLSTVSVCQAIGSSNTPGGGFSFNTVASAGQVASTGATSAQSVTSNNTGGTSPTHNNMQPTTFVTFMIKL